MSGTAKHAKDAKQDLPPGWRWVRLGEVCEVNPRRPQLDRADDEPTSFVPMESVDAITGTIADLRTRPFGEVKKGYTWFAENDVLFAKITPCMQNGKHAIAQDLIGGFGFGTTEFHVLRASPQIAAEWIWLFVRQPTFLQEATEQFTGSVGQQRLPDGFLKSRNIPLPPLPEQRRIAGILKEQMAAVDQARAAAEARLEAVKALPAAYLREVFPNAGEALPNGWRWTTLEPFIAETRNGFGRRPQPDEKGVIVLRLADVSKGYVDLSDPRQGLLARDEIEIYGLQTGDLLFVRVNGSSNLVGRAVLIEPEYPALVFNDHLIRVRLTEAVLPDFLRLYSDAPVARRHFVEYASTSAGQLTISRDALNALPLPLPPLSDQRRLAARLREQMAAVEKACAAAEAELAAINDLPAALLRRAFNGEL